MNRRKFLAGTAGALTIGLAGCSEDNDPAEEQESGGSGGPQTDYDKAVNTVDGETIIDLHMRAWFSCSYADPTDVTFTIDFIAGGETIDSREWSVEFEDCMNEHTRTMSIQLPDQYEAGFHQR